MPSSAEVTTALWGAVRLARFDAKGLRVFGHRGVDAARSFFAVAVVAPMYLIWVAIHGSGTPEGTPAVYAIPYEVLVYTGGWLLFPVLMWHVARSMDRESKFAHYICAYNWVAVVQNALFLVLDLAAVLSGAPGGARSLFGIMLLTYVLIYCWFVAKHALGITGPQAAMIVTLDLVTSLTWETFTDGLAGG